MKKYIIFAISFLFLFSIFRVLTGMLLTFAYTPDMTGAWDSSGGLSQGVIIRNGSPFLLTLFFAFLSATIAYFIPKKFTKTVVSDE